MKQPIFPTQISSDQTAIVAGQLRKPEGDFGKTIANNMDVANKKMILKTLQVLNSKENDNILEIGMGSGLFVKNILKKSKTIKYTGLDYSETMVKMAKQNNSAYITSEQANFVCANTLAIPQNDNYFNKIFTINTFYFWDHHELVLKELKRVLKPKGTLIIAIRPKQIIEKYPFAKHNFALWSTSKIIELLKKNSFTEIEVTKIKEAIENHFEQPLKKEVHIIYCKKANI